MLNPLETTGLVVARVGSRLAIRQEQSKPMRKKIIKPEPGSPGSSTSMSGELNVVAIATALVSSEEKNHPIEHAFDEQRGPGGSRWVAEYDGEQTLILGFDTPQSIRRVALEVEETAVPRTQELQLAASWDNGETYRELLRQEFNFAPPHTSFEREEWQVEVRDVTHLRLWIKPDKSGKPCRATLTSLVLNAG
jgi:hypothetical protein